MRTLTSFSISWYLVQVATHIPVTVTETISSTISSTETATAIATTTVSVCRSSVLPCSPVNVGLIFGQFPLGGHNHCRHCLRNRLRYCCPRCSIRQARRCQRTDQRLAGFVPAGTCLCLGSMFCKWCQRESWSIHPSHSARLTLTFRIVGRFYFH